MNLTREEYKEYLRELLSEDEYLANGYVGEEIYEIDDIVCYGGYDHSSPHSMRGLDHNCLLTEDLTKNDIARWGILIIPETKCYISERPSEKYDELGYQYMPADED